MIEQKKKGIVECLQCHKKFAQKFWHQLFCSVDPCRKAYYKELAQRGRELAAKEKENKNEPHG